MKAEEYRKTHLGRFPLFARRNNAMKVRLLVDEGLLELLRDYLEDSQATGCTTEDLWLAKGVNGLIRDLRTMSAYGKKHQEEANKD